MRWGVHVTGINNKPLSTCIMLSIKYDIKSRLNNIKIERRNNIIKEYYKYIII